MNSAPIGMVNDISKRRTFLKLMIATGSLVHLSTVMSKNLFAQEFNNHETPQPESCTSKGNKPVKTLLFCVSLHHQNTAKIANVFSRVLSPPIKSPSEVTIDTLTDYGMIGFGSGIYSQKHHSSILAFVDRIPAGIRKNALIFSTSGISRNFAVKNSIDDPHSVIRKILQRKEWPIVGDFNCAGWNTNSFLKVLWWNE